MCWDEEAQCARAQRDIQRERERALFIVQKKTQRGASNAGVVFMGCRQMGLGVLFYLCSNEPCYLLWTMEVSMCSFGSN